MQDNCFSQKGGNHDSSISHKFRLRETCLPILPLVPLQKQRHQLKPQSIDSNSSPINCIARSLDQLAGLGAINVEPGLFPEALREAGHEPRGATAEGAGEVLPGELCRSVSCARGGGSNRGSPREAAPSGAAACGRGREGPETKETRRVGERRRGAREGDLQ